MPEGPEFYSKIGLGYEAAYGQAPALVKFLEKVPAYLSPKSHILDIGCGTGKPVAASLSSAGHNVMGIDSSETMISLSKKAVPNGQFEIADMRTFEPPGGIQFDAVFQILSLFTLNREEIEGMAANWGKWTRPGGLLSVGSVAAEDMPAETRINGYDEDGLCSRDIKNHFMGIDTEITLFTRDGWEKLLRKHGFEIKETITEVFYPAKEVDSEDEYHYFIIAEKGK